MEADGRLFHKEHFTCVDCNEPITADGGFVWKGDQPQCMFCNGLVCNSCNGLIHSHYVRLRVPNSDAVNTYHNHCFACSSCRTSLSGQTPVFHNGALFCRSCLANPSAFQEQQPVFPPPNLAPVREPEPVFEPVSEPVFEPVPEKEFVPEPILERELERIPEPVPEVVLEPPREEIAVKAVKSPPMARASFAPLPPSNRPDQTINRESYDFMVSEGELTQTEAELLLYNRNIPVSFFVYRAEGDREADLTLAFMYSPEKIRHIKLQRRAADGRHYLDPKGESFEHLDVLVDHYKSHEVLDTGARLGESVALASLKGAVVVPGAVPQEMASDYYDYTKKLKLCEFMADVATGVEQKAPEGTELHQMARECGDKNRAEVNLFKVVLESPFFGYDEENVAFDRFDSKGKFEADDYMTAAVGVLDAKATVIQSETRRNMSVETFTSVMEVEEVFAATNDPSITGNTLDELICQYWATVQPDPAGRLSEDAFLELAKAALPRRRDTAVEAAYRESKNMEHLRKLAKAEGGLTLSSFKEFLFKSLYFPEQIRLFRQYAKKSKDFITVLEFQNFLKTEQKLKNLERLSQLWYGLGSEQAAKDQAAKAVFGAHLSHNGNGFVSIFGFLNFLQSEENSVFNPVHRVVYQDMKLPLSEYFVDSSHNSYLEGDQLKSPSTTDAYRRILQSGCRCVELDLWDGPKSEPVIYHGFTLTSKVPARAVLETIAKYAFETSPYPVILSLENHLSLPQQLVFAQYVKEVFKTDAVPSAKIKFWESNPQLLPSPEKLKFKILIKSKAHPTRDHVAAEKLDPKKLKVAKELSDFVVYTKAVSFTTLDAQLKCYEMSSFSEKKAMKLAKTETDAYVNFTRGNLARSYPDGKRFDSSNPDPQPFWNVGLQLCALNFQRPDRAMQLNEGKFSQNGHSGYVLKPESLRRAGTLNMNDLPYLTLSVRLLSGHNLLHPKLKRKSAIVVEIELSGFTNQVATTLPLPVSHAGDLLWPSEKYDFEVRLPELELLRLTAFDSVLGNKDPTGEFTLPIDSLQQGFHCVPLKIPQPFGKFDSANNATLFVQISIIKGRPAFSAAGNATAASTSMSTTSPKASPSPNRKSIVPILGSSTSGFTNLPKSKE